MVLSCGGSDAQPEMFSGGADDDVTNIFFLFEHVTKRAKDLGDCPAELMCHIIGEAFDFFYETFARIVTLINTAMDYQGVKN